MNYGQIKIYSYELSLLKQRTTKTAVKVEKEEEGE